MGLFGFKKEKEVKEKEVKENTCCCGGTCDGDCMDSECNTIGEDKSIKVLGGGCAKCHELEANVKKALEQLGMDTTIDHVTDFTKIAAYGVMSTPALVVDGKVVSYGKVLKTEEAVKILEKTRG